MSGEFICSGCKRAGYIVSVEIITEAFPCYLDDGNVEYDGAGGKTWGSYREYFMCKHCEKKYHDEDDLLELDTEVSE